MKNSIKLFAVAVLCSLTSFAFAQGNAKENAGDGTVVFWFTRHGKTILNTMDRVQGWSDAALTPAGIEVAEYLGAGLKAEGVTFRTAYSSDLGRARWTARIVLDGVGQKDLPINETDKIRETNFGSYEGETNFRMWQDAALYLGYKSRDEFMKALTADRGKLVDAIGAFKALETLGIGEDYHDVKTRGQAFIREIAEIEAKKGGGNVLVVGHGMSIGVFLSDLDDFGKTPEAAHMANAAVSKVIYKDGKFRLESFGDTQYIEKGKALAGKK